MYASQLEWDVHLLKLVLRCTQKMKKSALILLAKPASKVKEMGFSVERGVIEMVLVAKKILLWPRNTIWLLQILIMSMVLVESRCGEMICIQLFEQLFKTE